MFPNNNNIVMEYEDKATKNVNLLASNKENIEVALKTPIVNLISSGGTKSCLEEANVYHSKDDQETPIQTNQWLLSKSSPKEMNIELLPLCQREYSTRQNETGVHQPLEMKPSFSIASAGANVDNDLSPSYYYLSSPSVYGTPTGPRHLLYTPNVQSPFSQVSSAVPSYRTAYDTTPPVDFNTIGQDRSHSRNMNSLISRARNHLTGHSRLDITPSISSSPERTSHPKSWSNHCIIASSLIITGIMMVIGSVICLALVDNTVPDHEYGILYPLYEALYALRGQARPINSYDLNIKDLDIDVIPIHQLDIKDYSETYHITEHGPHTIFDKDYGTFWNPVIQVPSSYFAHPPGYSITVDLLHNYTITAVRIRDFGNYEHDVTDCKLEVNINGVWRLVTRHPAIPPGHKLVEINGFAVWGSLWKFTVLGTASGKQPWIKELQFYGFKYAS